jgi:outer membrane lipoprotein-sorting protein
MKKIIILLITITVIWQKGFTVTDKRADAILKRVDRRLGFPAYTALSKIINLEPNGLKKEFIMKTFKKGDKRIANLFLSPATDKGRTTLRVGDNMWMFIQSAGRPIRIASLQSVIGGVFNNSDLLRFEFHVEYNARLKKENAAVIELELKAKTNMVAYDKLYMIIDKRYYTPIRLDCYSASGILIKTLNFKNIKNFGNNLVRPSVIDTTSPLQRGYRSLWILGRITPAYLRDDIFTLNYMSILSARGN